MSKPSWKDAPKWAKYLAMDSTGEWYWFEVKPTCMKSRNGIWHSDQGRAEPAKPVYGWEDTLEEKPK